MLSKQFEALSMLPINLLEPEQFAPIQRRRCKNITTGYRGYRKIAQTANLDDSSDCPDSDGPKDVNKPGPGGDSSRALAFGSQTKGMG